MFPFFLFQDPTTNVADTGEVVPEEVSFSLIEVIFSGGPIGVVIAVILLLLAVMAVYILIERYLTIKRAGDLDENFMAQIRGFVQTGDVESALALCRQTNTPVARLVAKGLQRIGKPLEDINAAVENVGNLEIFQLEKRLSTLATISGAAPMIGFFGTVTGMILSFMNMAGGDVSTEALAGGIYQALITTAFGLFVGIIAFIGYNSLIASMGRVIFKMEAATVEFMDLLQEPA
ncbi:MotA/TolQ/ExbB proton channel family protein [Saprospira sp. CCB-QB6]|uniref:MotA/TolQ/ExbB proton channel family protein n=1 Tax=Saprospira sp. CCB-QB6 TaxID=3023936 RepID=UPI00234A4586|nr:MotA/TolQ/ExbB proton channel family protein [Saprospira sp. CCB-QB6]WCL81649.1 MotA/TolQ/ExbB proton channel family protein [Saprospira sp. CCB-QB6]